MSSSQSFTAEMSATGAATKTDRLIDSDTNAYIKIKKVLVLGMPMTGTNSMLATLTRLGFNPYHMNIAIANHERDISLWNEAYEAKFLSVGQKYSRVEFDKLLGPYDAVADAPCAYVAGDLIKASPDSEVILTNRDPDEWLNAMKSTIFSFHGLSFSNILAKFDPLFFGPFLRGSKLVQQHLWGDMGGEQTREAYFTHYNRIRELVTPNRLLEFDASRSGWEPLCDFLDVPVPAATYPHIDDSKAHAQTFGMIKQNAINSIISRLAFTIAMWIPFFLALYYFGLTVFLPLFLLSNLFFGFDNSQGDVDLSSVLSLNQPPAPAKPALEDTGPRSIPPHLHPRQKSPESRPIPPSPPRDHKSPRKSTSSKADSAKSSQKSSPERSKWGLYSNQIAKLRAGKSPPASKPATSPKAAAAPVTPPKPPQLLLGSASRGARAGAIQRDDRRHATEAREREQEDEGYIPYMKESFREVAGGRRG